MNNNSSSYNDFQNDEESFDFLKEFFKYFFFGSIFYYRYNKFISCFCY